MGQRNAAAVECLFYCLIDMNAKGVDIFREQACQSLIDHAVALQARFAGKMCRANAQVVVTTAMLPDASVAGVFPRLILNNEHVRVKCFRQQGMDAFCGFVHACFFCLR